MTIDENIEYWLNSANENLIDAEGLLNIGRYLFAGYACQLAIEKMLKAIIASYDKIPPKIHNLTRLSEIAKIDSLLEEKQITLLDIISGLQIEARYPNYKEKLSQQLNKEKCEEYLAFAKEFYQWVTNKLLKQY